MTPAVYGSPRANHLLCGLLFSALLFLPTAARAQATTSTAPELPETIPLFPLPTVAIFPNLQLPLHVFEPRYLEMLADALAGARVIGIIQLQPGFEGDYQGRPPIFSVGCAAIILGSEKQPGGEFDIGLRGFKKFRITSETGNKAYRLAHVVPIEEPIDDQMRAALRSERPALEAAIATSLGIERTALRLPVVTDEDLVNSIVMTFDFDTVDRQVLIEQPDVLARARKLAELLREAPGGQPPPRR